MLFFNPTRPILVAAYAVPQNPFLITANEETLMIVSTPFESRGLHEESSNPDPADFSSLKSASTAITLSARVRTSIARVLKEENFEPVLIVSTFRANEEVLVFEKASDSEYGLGGFI